MLREKAISGMVATSGRRDTDVEDRKESISHLKKVIRLQCADVLTLCNGVDRSLKS